MLARRYQGAALSAGVLSVLGVRPQLGRGFLPEDERPGAPGVVLLSYKTWQRDFGGDPKVIGRAVRWAGKPASIVGVMPPQFSFPERGESWVNLRASTAADEQWVEVIGRLRDGVTPAAARAENAAAGRDFTLPAIGIGRPLRAGRLLIQSFQDAQIPTRIRVLLLTLLGVAGGVLALASMNVATLLFLRALVHERELALRLAIGGSRGRLVRQMLCESLTLAALGVAGGVLIAWLGVALLDRQFSLDSQKPYWIRFELDYMVLAATVLLTFLTGLAAGLLPALRASRLNLSGILKDKSLGLSSLRMGKLSRVLTTVQATAACTLLVITGILARGVGEMGRVSLPFDATRTLGASLDTAPYVGEGEALDRFRASLLERAGALPGVMAATLAAHHPFDNSSRVVIGLRDGSRGSGSAYREFVAANYMQALGVPFREGRGFTAADRDAVVINESLARRYWPGESPLGRQFRETDATEPRPWLTVIGVVADLPMQGVLRAESSAGYYAPLTSEWPWRVCLLLRSGAPPGALVRPLRETIRELAPDLPVYDISTVAEFADHRLATARTMAGLGLTFAAGALFLAAIGVHGVTAFAAERRAREFGIRLALGARTAHIVVLVLRQAILQGGIALAIGLALGYLLSRPLVAAMGQWIGSAGVEIYAGIAGVIFMVLAVALWLPARRSLKVDPALTLRAE
jgi:predicted permease